MAYIGSGPSRFNTADELTVSGDATLNGNANLGDNGKAQFGAGNDLQVFHDATDSHVVTTNGDLNLQVAGGGTINLGDQFGNTLLKVVDNADVKLYHGTTPSEKLATTSTGIDVTGTITFDGGTTSADLNFGDNDKAVFGAGSDLEINHTGTHSDIKETGTGDLRIWGDDIKFYNSAGSKFHAQMVTDGAVTLYNNGQSKLTTASTGIDVTGAMYASGNIGLDSTDYIAWTNNTRLDFYVNGANDMRLENDGDLHVEGDVIAFSTTIASDPRLKENVEPVTDALSKVERLTGYTFDYKHGGASAGVMSTDVEKVLPSAVSQTTLPLKTGDEETEYDVVAYDQLHALLIEAVKELSARVTELENGASK